MKYIFIALGVLLVAILLPILLILLIQKLMKKKWKVWVKILVTAFSAIIITLSAGLIYLSVYYHATEEVSSSLESDDQVTVSESGDYYRFDNTSNEEKAIIFYGGAKVEEKAYAPLLRQIAEKGIDVYLLKIPFRFAFLGVNKADTVMSQYHYSSLYLMGHSLGGTTASLYLSSSSYDYQGIIFLASYPSKPIKEGLSSLSFYGTEDKVMNHDEYEKKKSLLPSQQEEIILEGGNHAYYGNYGEQKGDGVASISRDEQQSLVSQKVVKFVLSE